ncbi:MAG: tetratricopeptide repeat protein [Myxococcota bacterium]
MVDEPCDASGLLPLLESRRLTVLAGAGISMVPPAGLPSWWQLNHAVLDALEEQAAVITDHAASIIETVKAKQDAGSMPPEYTSEVITLSIAEEYFEVLRCLEGTRINAVHGWLAALAKAKRLPAIVTTNFDTLIERACEAIGAPLRVLVTAGDYEGLDIRAQLEDPDAPTLLLKLHGTATQPTTCIDTLAQRKRGLAPQVGLALQALVAHTRMCILGYSGADLEAEPNYLFLRQMASRPDTPGFDWLVLPDSEVLEAVEQVAACYGDSGRARIIPGRLPEWLEAWSPALDGTGVEPPHIDPGDATAQAEQREAARRSLHRQARAWGAELGPLSCSYIVHNLGERVEAPLLESCLRALAWAEDNAVGTLSHGIAHLQASGQLRIAGRVREALEHARQAMAIFFELEVGAAYDDAMAALAAILKEVNQLADAEKMYRQSLEVSEQFEGDEERVMRWQRLAHVVAALGRHREALELLERAHAIAVGAGDETARAAALEGRAMMLAEFARRDEALALYGEAEQVRRRLGQLRPLGYNLCQQAGSLGYLGSYDDAHQRIAEGLAIAAEIGDEQLVAHLGLQRAALLAHVGDYREAVAELRRSAERLEATHDARGRVDAAVSLVGLLATQGDFAGAITEAEAGLATASKAGLLSQQAKLHVNVGIAHESSGQLDRAAEQYERGHELSKELGIPRLMMMAEGNLANLRYRQGRLDDAAKGYEQVIATATTLGAVPVIVRSLANLANIAKVRKDLGQAERAYLEAIRVAEEHDIEALTAHPRLNLGLLEWERGQLERAETTLGEAHAGLRAQDDRPNAGTAAWYRTDSLLRLGRPTEAKASVQAAIEAWDGTERPELTKAREILEQLEASGA